MDHDSANAWQGEADALRTDIRAALAESVDPAARRPLGDGRWVRTSPPWAGHGGPLAIDRQGRHWFTHGAATARDSLLGPMWLIFQEVLSPEDPLATSMLEYHAELFHDDNAAFSQPY